MIRTGLLYILLMSVFIFGCKKSESDDEQSKGSISDIPEINIISVNPINVLEFQDSIVFVIQYIDGNGDIGTENADTKSLYLTDNRVNITESYHIPPLAPLNSSIAIQGNLNVVLNKTAVFGTANSESATFSIYLVDRAGNSSNTVTSESITINK